MGNHRADRRGSSQPTAETAQVTPARPKRRAAVPVDSAPSAARAASAAPGRRRKLDATPEVAGRPYGPLPVAAAPATPPRPTAAPARTTGTAVASHRGAPKRRAQGSPLFKTPLKASVLKVPALPTVIGSVALVAAAGGAIGLGAGNTLPGSPSLQLSSGATSQLNGTDAFSLGDRDSRAEALSRDSQGQARRDAANQELKAAAEQQSQQRSVKLASLAASAEERADQIVKNLWVLPTIGYHITARFGWSSGLWSHGHTGLDFAAHVGTPIYAIAGGVITETGYDGAYGNKTVQTLPDGTEIWYCHQNAIDVSVGDKVTQQQQIGEVGNTGNTTGPHLHIEVRPVGGDPVDPYPAFLEHGITP